MRILFDQGAPAPLRTHLTGHDISTAFERGWSTLQNGELLREAEAKGFEAFVTTDKNLRYQQDLTERRIAVIVLSTTSWPRIRRQVGKVQFALGGVTANSYVEIEFD